MLTYCGLAALMLSLVRGSVLGKAALPHIQAIQPRASSQHFGEPSFVKEDIQSPAATSARPELAFDFPLGRGTEDSTVDCLQLSSELKAKTWWKRLWWYRGQYLSGQQYFVRTLVASYLESFFGLGFWWAGVVDYSRMKSLGHPMKRVWPLLPFLQWPP